MGMYEKNYSVLGDYTTACVNNGKYKYMDLKWTLLGILYSAQAEHMVQIFKDKYHIHGYKYILCTSADWFIVWINNTLQHQVS